VSYTDGEGNYMEEPVPPEELAQAATQALADLADAMQPFVKALQHMAVVAIPVLRAAVEPLAQAIKDAGLDKLTPEQLEALVEDVAKGKHDA
jgi:hypothetical protein